jgi:hypothetical protein
LIASQNKSIEAQDFMDRFERNSPLNKIARFDEPTSNDLLLDDSGICMMTPPALSRTSTPGGRRNNASNGRTHRNSANNFMASGVDLAGVNSPSGRSTPQSTASGIVLCSSTPFQGQSFQPQVLLQSKSNIDTAMKKARANAFFDR